MNKPKIAVILGSIREGRAGEKVAKWFMDTVKDATSADLELVDLKDYPLPLFADAQPPSRQFRRRFRRRNKKHWARIRHVPAGRKFNFEK